MKKDNDKNKYVAAILQRHYIDNNKYLYTFHHLETGSYDDKRSKTGWMDRDVC